MNSPLSRGRALATVALFWALYLGILYLASIPKGMVPARFQDLLWGALSGAALLGVTWLILRREARSPAEVGLVATGKSGLQFGGGLLLGLALYAGTMVAVHLIAEPLSLEPTGQGTIVGTLIAILAFLALSLMEELGFRGYPLRTLIPAIGFWPAQLLVAVAFALSHRLFGWGWETILFGVLPNGLLFGMAATSSRGLAFPVGLHAALNLAAWSVNAKEMPGIWNIVIPDIMGSNVGPVAAWSNVVLTLGVAGGLWWYGRRTT